MMHFLRIQAITCTSTWWRYLHSCLFGKHPVHMRFCAVVLLQKHEQMLRRIVISESTPYSLRSEIGKRNLRYVRFDISNYLGFPFIFFSSFSRGTAYSSDHTSTCANPNKYSKEKQDEHHDRKLIEKRYSSTSTTTVLCRR